MTGSGRKRVWRVQDVRGQALSVLSGVLVARGGDFLDPTKNGVGDPHNKIKHEVVDRDSDLRSKYIPAATSLVGALGGPEGEAAAHVVDAINGLGKPRRTRKGGVAPSVLARNRIVQQVMRQRKCSLPEASKIVRRRGCGASRV